MVTTYRTREEKELAVIQALMAGPRSKVKTMLVCPREQVAHNINDVEAGFIFMAIESDRYVVKQRLLSEKELLRKGDKKDDKSNGELHKDAPAGDDSEDVRPEE